jgi:hypothetical protein
VNAAQSRLKQGGRRLRLVIADPRFDFVGLSAAVAEPVLTVALYPIRSRSSLNSYN